MSPYCPSNLPDWAQKAGKRAETVPCGPWEVEGTTIICPDAPLVRVVTDGFTDEEMCQFRPSFVALLSFIAAARTDIPRILAAWAEDREKLERAEAELAVESRKVWDIAIRAREQFLRSERAMQLLRISADRMESLKLITVAIDAFLREEDARE